MPTATKTTAKTTAANKTAAKTTAAKAAPRARKAQSDQASSTAQILALDAGNYDLKFFSGQGHPKAIRSVRFRLPQGRDAVSYSEASPLIELPNGRREHFGAQAYKYRRQQQTVIENKVEFAKLHFYACLEPLADSAEFPVHLLVSTPDPIRHADEIRAQLLGLHEFKRNGTECRVTVESVTVEREGMGAYYHAQQQGLIPNVGYTVVVDIGGGTWLTRLVDSDGEVIDENIMDRGGTYELATAISFDRRLINALGTTVDPCVIMDGFRTGHGYADTGLSWAGWLDEYLDPWFKGIFQMVKAQYTPYMARVTRFLVTGGGSHLIAERLEGRKLFAVLRDPQFANVLGLYSRSTDQQLCLTTKSE
ncbi:MAG: ParM/StbA family protein [Leptolyngbya sp. SIO4C1]|nr:ParM/StbA family protein [Leptolyngbya sp. SIO4C1]